ncbi:Scr1 family TA system antitoxin-like transcriptional regulator [Streptomyces sp. NBC_01363]|uniref:Scr1 family TA system antitoxin-like transcriptional regulator n=1 Tax=Streptomyces sp. NBC_01363 TaxID=2903840 RepID=UPI003390310D
MCRRSEQCRTRADETRPQGFLQWAYRSLRTLRTVRHAPRPRRLRPGRTATAATSASPGLGRNACPPTTRCSCGPRCRRPYFFSGVGGPHVMNAQLEHLLAGPEHPHVVIQVLPFPRGVHASEQRTPQHAPCHRFRPRRLARDCQ